MKEQNIKELRITTGIAKNKKLKTPDIEGFRAVQEVAKASLFSMLGEKIVDAECLDLFAGSGNLGIEALSRGAIKCDFVDEHPLSIKAIEENLVSCGLIESSELFRKDVLKYILNKDRNYDVIFIDPFYKNTNQKHLLSNIGNLLKENGVIAFFHGDNLNIKDLIQDTNLTIVDERKFGKSFFTLLTLK